MSFATAAFMGEVTVSDSGAAPDAKPQVRARFSMHSRDTFHMAFTIFATNWRSEAFMHHLRLLNMISGTHLMEEVALKDRFERLHSLFQSFFQIDEMMSQIQSQLSFEFLTPPRNVRPKRVRRVCEMVDAFIRRPVYLTLIMVNYTIEEDLEEFIEILGSVCSHSENKCDGKTDEFRAMFATMLAKGCRREIAKRLCAVCQCESKYVCSGCGHTRYCCRAHQRADWRQTGQEHGGSSGGHRQKCQNIKTVATAASSVPKWKK